MTIKGIPSSKPEGMLPPRKPHTAGHHAPTPHESTLGGSHANPKPVEHIEEIRKATKHPC